MKRRILKIVLSLGIIITSLVYIYNNFYNPDPEFSITVDSEVFESNISSNNILEPGGNVTSNIKVENTKNKDISYSIFLDKLEGKLIDKLIFNVYYEEILVYTSLAINFNEDNAYIPPVLKAGGMHSFHIKIELDETGNINDYQGEHLYFDIKLRNNKNN